MPKEITYIRLDPAVKQALSRVAQIDGRSLSALISKIATDWAKEFAANSRASRHCAQVRFSGAVGVS